MTADGTGLVVSSSRAILYASSGDDYAEAAATAAQALRDEINRFRYFFWQQITQLTQMKERQPCS